MTGRAATLGPSLVVDASTVVAMLIDPAAATEGSERLHGAVLHAPDHLLVEVANVLRRYRNARRLPADVADEAFALACALPVNLWPLAATSARVWQLGVNLSSYDAAYVALAERLGVPLVTRDARIGRAPGVECRVDVW